VPPNATGQDFTGTLIQTFSVSLSANPSSGSVPLNVDLTAQVLGSAVGTINYTFWWNCSNPGTSVEQVMAICGNIPTPSLGECAENANGKKCNAVTEQSKTVNHVYTSDGTYTAKVIAERGSTPPAEARVSVVASLITYSISGRIADSSNNPISGVTISDGAGHTTTTNESGRYTLSGLIAGTYTLTPSRSGYSFSPSSRQVTLPPNQTSSNFTAILVQTYSSISGRVTDNGGNPMAGVTLLDGLGHSATTDSNGNYTIGGLSPGGYAITPSKSGYAFSPSFRTVTVPPSATAQDFAGMATMYSIVGRVADSAGNAIPDVMILGIANQTPTTDSNGNYALSNLTVGTYTLTPSKRGYTFSPSTLQVTVPPNQTGKNFVGNIVPTTYSISGRVTDSGGNAISGVIISAGLGANATTDANGNYTLSGLAVGMYTLIPSRSGYTFSPTSRTVSVPPNSPGQDFVGNGYCQAITSSKARAATSNSYADVPPVSPSYYIVATTEISKTLLSTNMSQLGLKVATRFRSQFKTDSAPHRLVLLQFGAPLFVGGKLGVTLTPGNPVPNPAGADIDTVKGYVTGFADGYIHAYRDYWNQLPTLYIGVGTSNDGSLNVDEMRRHGRAWGAMINSINLDLEQKFQDLQLSRKIFAFGANDMELGWNDPAHTLAWIEGYKSTAWSSLIDSGNTDCVYSTGHCINGWELDKVLEKVIGDGRTWAVPQIYHTNGNDAVQWANLWKYSGGKPPSIRGVLTTYQACQQSETQDPLCNGVINNKPEDAWQSLRSKVTETLPSCSNWQGPHLLTDIRYFRSSKNPPWADLIRVNWPAQKAAHEILTITWEAGDPDGDPLFYEILYMPTETRLISCNV
jgi:protocatechuate 3,4-dioxygenase beta subunit